MPSRQPENDRGLADHWTTHREYLKRLLISLTRDIDLAEDLLQETYLLADHGWGNFRGGDVRAWLATIAKHAFYSHCRKCYLRAEVPLDLDVEPALAYATDETDSHLLTALRQAIAALPPALRDALVMKHYGGFSYQEIAERLCCPVGTAKWRVSTAIGRMKSSLGLPEKEVIVPIPVTRLLDYLYGRLSEKEAAFVRAQLAKSADSRAELQVMEQVLHTLDALEGEVKTVEIAVLDAEGGVTRYYYLGATVNRTQETAKEADWMLTDNVELRAVLLQGQEAPTHEVGREENTIKYKSPFPRPVRPGESIGPVLVVTYEKDGAKPVGEGRRQFRIGGTIGINVDSWVYIEVVRLPPGAELITADPPADETRRNDATMLVWRHVSSALTESTPGKWYIDGIMEYRL